MSLRYPGPRARRVGASRVALLVCVVVTAFVALPLVASADTRVKPIVTVAPASGPEGGTATLSATLTDPAGAPIVGRKIVFRLNGALVGTAFTNASGVATLTGVSVAGIKPGHYPNAVFASYGGDGTYMDAFDYGDLTVTYRSTTTLATSEPRALVGAPVTFTATVSPAIATGTVTFTDNGAVLGSAALVSGTATFTTSELALGPHGIRATYSGDADHSGSVSERLVQYIVVATTTSVVSSNDDADEGTPVTFTATISPAPASGTVYFWATDTSTNTSMIIGEGTVAAGVATFETSTLPAGVYEIRAAFSGNHTHRWSVSPPIDQAINAGQVIT